MCSLPRRRRAVVSSKRARLLRLQSPKANRGIDVDVVMQQTWAVRGNIRENPTVTAAVANQQS
eukprot:357297-Amphidinium_carterae.1